MTEEEKEKQNKINALNATIREGDLIESFLTSETGEVIIRTLTALKRKNKMEAYDYAKNKDVEIRYFLGRMEQVDELLDILRFQFVDRRGRAIEEKLLMEELDKDQAIQDQITHNQVVKPPYAGQNPGIMG